MQKANQYFKNGILIILLGLIAIPIILSKIKKPEELPIYGAFDINEKPIFSKADYKEGVYQDKYAKYFNDAIPFRSYFLKFHNQFQFSLFREVYLEETVIGKEDFLYEKTYLNELNGKRFIGDAKIQTNTDRIKFIQTELNKRGKNLIVVFAPGKASFFPEYIPSNYLKKIGTSNYEAYVKAYTTNKINFIDFLAYFNKIKMNSKYPLYGKNGIHWSVYGMHLAMDSLVRNMEFLIGKSMPKKVYNSLEISDTARFVDNDLEKGLNLLLPLNDFKLVYPNVSFKESGYRPNVIVVSDSYWWVVHNAFIPHNQFNKYHFFYYNNSVYNKESNENLVISEPLIDNLLKETDIVLLLCTEANMNHFPFGFDKQLERVLSHDYNKKVNNLEILVKEKIIQIKNDTVWYKSIQIKAKQNKVSIETQLEKDAKWMIENE